MGVRAWLDNLRRRLLNRGYSCDACGSELFDYPIHRLCKGCEDKLRRPQNPCPLCGRERVADGLCLDCKAEVPKYTRGVAPFVYIGESALLINRMKNGNERLAAYLGEEMAKAFAASLAALREESLLLLPVPTTAERRRERGFNPAERLTESANERLHDLGFTVEKAFTVLEKRTETREQKKLSRQERKENVRSAYAVIERGKVKGRSVVLVDDVTTTGSTGNEIAAKLRKAGAKEVYFLTVAAVPEKK